LVALGEASPTREAIRLWWWVWRVAVSEFRCETETGSALPRFRLGRGSFANAALRELVDGISGVSDV
jgi:tRNA(Glu) U13 pseudouridine synthase TruD